MPEVADKRGNASIKHSIPEVSTDVDPYILITYLKIKMKGGVLRSSGKGA